MKGPWWRWWIFNRKRRGPLFRRGRLKILSIVGLLILLDQVSKTTLTTQDWAWHYQPQSWLLYALAASLISAPLLFTIASTPATLVLAGAVGNASSELTHGSIANPLQIQYGLHQIAFNLADVYLVTGYALAIYTAVTIVVHLVNAPRRQPA